MSGGTFRTVRLYRKRRLWYMVTEDMPSLEGKDTFLPMFCQLSFYGVGGLPKHSSNCTLVRLAVGTAFIHHCHSPNCWWSVQLLEKEVILHHHSLICRKSSLSVRVSDVEVVLGRWCLLYSCGTVGCIREIPTCQTWLSHSCFGKWSTMTIFCPSKATSLIIVGLGCEWCQMSQPSHKRSTWMTHSFSFGLSWKQQNHSDTHTHCHRV